MMHWCGPGNRLILTHTLLALDRPGSRERAITDVASLYEVEIILAEELARYEL